VLHPRRIVGRPSERLPSSLEAGTFSKDVSDVEYVLLGLRIVGDELAIGKVTCPPLYEDQVTEDKGPTTRAQRESRGTQDGYEEKMPVHERHLLAEAS
jgi:hypothetical protein